MPRWCATKLCYVDGNEAARGCYAGYQTNCVWFGCAYYYFTNCDTCY
ncbi:MAG TPA: hypothetical protein VG672_30430 [Bryobacteraceae bacterium]|nr:hypothetical protein [Bryobacteraceae bacterium]